MPIYLGKKHIANITSSVVESSPTEGTNTEDATLSSGDQMLKGVTAYAKDVKYTGTIETVSAPTPTISVSDTGLIAATVDNPKGYQSIATTKIATTQLSTQVAKTVTPSNETQTAVASGVYTTGDVVVSAVPTETKTITANGTYSPTSGKYFSSVEVAIAGDAPTYQSKTVSPTEEAQTVIPDTGYDALSDVTVNAIQTETKSVTSNGSYSPTSGKYFSEVTVNVPNTAADPILQSKIVTPTESSQTVTADTGYDGLDAVTVEAISSTYIGSAVPTQKATTITPTTSTQTAVASGTYTAGDIMVEAIPDNYIDTSDATATSNDLVAGTTAYVDGELVKGGLNGYYNNTSQGCYQNNLIDSYSFSPGDLSPTASLMINVGFTERCYVESSSETITYPIIRFVAGNAVPSDVLAGKYFTSGYGENGVYNNIAGTLVVNTYYTGSSEPSSSFGEDGDLYLMIEE